MRLLLRPTWLTRRIPLWSLLRATPHSAVHHTSTTNIARVKLPKLLVKPGSEHHHSLSTYLEYVARGNLSTENKYYIGTHYEYTAAEALQRFGFSLIRTGQKNDAGIDLIGHWMLSFLREPMPVIIQCKCRLRPCAPVAIRELEGAFHSVPPEWRNQDVLGLLVTTHHATEGTRMQMHMSSKPLAFLQVSRTGDIVQFLWNQAATQRGLEGVGVTPRYTVLPLASELLNYEDRPRDARGRLVKDPDSKRRLKIHQSREVVTDIQLTWLGTPVYPDQEEVASVTAKRIRAVAIAHAEAKEAKKEAKKAAAGTRKAGRPLGSKTGSRAARLKAAEELKEIKLKLSKLKKDNPAQGTITAKRRRRAEMGIKGRESETPLHIKYDQAGSGPILPVTEPPKKRGRPRKTQIEVPDG